MKTAAVMIDDWKLPIFTKHLREAGYSYDTAPGLTQGTITLTVSYESIAAIQKVVEDAQKACAGQKGTK